MKEQLDAGNWQLPLSTISSSRATNATGSVELSGSAKTFTFIDDSSISAGTSTSSGKVFNVVSGSIDNGIHNPKIVKIGDFFNSIKYTFRHFLMYNFHGNYRTKTVQILVPLLSELI